MRLDDTQPARDDAARNSRTDRERDRILDVVRQLRSGKWRLPEAQEFSADFVDRIVPGHVRHTWRSPDAEPNGERPS